MKEIADDLTRLSSGLLQHIADTKPGTDSARKAMDIILERNLNSENRKVRWRVSTRDALTPSGVRIVALVDAADAPQAAIIFREELAGNAAQRTNSRVLLSTSDPRINMMRVVIDVNALTIDNLDIAYECEVEDDLTDL